MGGDSLSMNHPPLRPNQKRDLARALRADMTEAEKKLWRQLRQHQVLGVKFRRQVPVGPYIADFASFAHRLIIEADGGQHCESAHDAQRDSYLESAGWHVMRFWNTDILTNMPGVLEMIRIYVEAHSPHPDPPPQAGEGERMVFE